MHEHMKYIVDSSPVILAKVPRSRHAKVNGKLCAKSYNSSRKKWYYGLKIHALWARKPSRLPVPLSVMASARHHVTSWSQSKSWRTASI